MSNFRIANYRSDGKPKNGEGERSIAVGAPALQLSTAPRLFLPNSSALLPAPDRMCSHRYPTWAASNEQMARADTKGHFVTLSVGIELVTN